MSETIAMNKLNVQNEIYEIAQMLNDKASMQKDITDSLNGALNVFRDKYFGRIKKTVEGHHLLAQTNPCKEVQLLRTAKLFAPSDSHTGLDSMIEIMTLMDAASSIKGHMSKIAEENYNSYYAMSNDTQNSIHEDGIYEVDQACVIKGKSDSSGTIGVLLLMALAGLV